MGPDATYRNPCHSNADEDVINMKALTTHAFHLPAGMSEQQAGGLEMPWSIRQWTKCQRFLQWQWTQVGMS